VGKIRNRYFHEDQAPTDKETIDFVKEVIKIEHDLEILRSLKIQPQAMS
jgi:hypothetical protein